MSVKWKEGEYEKVMEALDRAIENNTRDGLIEVGLALLAQLIVGAAIIIPTCII
jgi:hypothetical protein